MRALVRVRATRHPRSREVIGLRLQATIPNDKARKILMRENGDMVITRKVVPSFNKPYLICESSDLPWINDADFERFKEKCKWAGYEEIEMLTTLAGGKIEEADDKPTKTYQELVNESRAQVGLPNIEEAPF